jgi:hypothetical protein
VSAMPTQLRRVVRWLRRKFPTNRQVVVRVARHQPGLHGICLLDEERALIRITQGDAQLMSETLLEEWAHVLREDCPVTTIQGDEHDALFWAILARVTHEYRNE